MKTIKYLFALLAVSLVTVSCSDDDDGTPDPVNEEELITTLTATMSPDGGGTPVVFVSRDLDGDGPNDPVITVSGNLTAGTTYNGTIVVLNESEDPAENITLEVIEEDDEHQFFFVAGGNLDVTTAYSDMDGDGNPLGVQFSVIANTASTGTLTFILRHEPKKPNDGTPSDAGGETDISATFDVTVE